MRAWSHTILPGCFCIHSARDPSSCTLLRYNLFDSWNDIAQCRHKFRSLTPTHHPGIAFLIRVRVAKLLNLQYDERRIGVLRALWNYGCLCCDDRLDDIHPEQLRYWYSDRHGHPEHLFPRNTHHTRVISAWRGLIVTSNLRRVHLLGTIHFQRR